MAPPGGEPLEALFSHNLDGRPHQRVRQFLEDGGPVLCMRGHSVWPGQLVAAAAAAQVRIDDPDLVQDFSVECSAVR